MSLFNQIINIKQDYYLYNWNIYRELIETKNNHEPFEFYDWESIKDNIKYYDILLLAKLDFTGNFDKIIDIVENIIIETIKQTPGYEYKDNKLELDWWVYENLVKCNNCSNIWDGFAQCNCYI